MPAVASIQPAASAHSKAAQEKVVLPALRGDLLISKQLYEGRTFYVVKDPVSLQYFRMAAEDYYLATLFDGRRNFGQVRDLYAAQFPHVRLEYTPEELNERVLRFANDLALMQFLSVQGQRLKARYEAQKTQKAKKKGTLYDLVNKVFFFRRSIFDPDKVFGKMAKPISWIWTRTSLWVSIGIIVLGIAVYILSADRIHPTMRNFFTFNNLVLIWITTFFIKAVHELGHGLTCKHFGGEVHEVGVMMLVFTPYFFVNVSDSWVMPERRHRILVSAAGIYVELVVAAFATFLWAIVQPGPFQDFLFNVMVIASFTTIVFNANPLMRFDGYYIMTDLIEVPNLQGKSRSLLNHQFKNLLFGKRGEDPVLARMPLPKKRFWLFYIYAVLSWLYGFYVIFKLTWFMSDRLAKYDLRMLGRFLSFSALLAWVIMPLWSFFRQLDLKPEDWKPHGRMRRFMVILGGALAAFTIYCFTPKDLTIQRACAADLASPEQIRPPISGFVREVLVKEGDHVTPGQKLAVLQNREEEFQDYQLQARVEILDVYIQQAVGTDKPVDLSKARSLQADAAKQAKEKAKDLASLTLTSQVGGVVVTRDLDRMVGRQLKPGELFCEIDSMDTMQVKMALNERQVRYVKKGQRADMKFNAYPAAAFSGTIMEVHQVLLQKDLPPALSGRRDGDVPTGVIDSKGQEVPLERTYEVRIDVANPDHLLHPGMAGHGSIHAGRYYRGQLVLQSLFDLISLDYRF